MCNNVSVFKDETEFGYPRGIWVFPKLQGLQYYFPEHFRCNLTYYETEHFSDSFPHHIFESWSFSFPFFIEKRPKLGSDMWKIKLQKIVGNLLGKLRKLFMNSRKGHLEWIFSCPQVMDDSRQYLLLRTGYFYRKHSLGAPDILL